MRYSSSEIGLAFFSNNANIGLKWSKTVGIRNK